MKYATRIFNAAIAFLIRNDFISNEKVKDIVSLWNNCPETRKDLLQEVASITPENPWIAELREAGEFL